MQTRKTLSERERELQTLLATPEGRQGLHELAVRYEQEAGGTRPPRGSVVTFILVHERVTGRISG
jgi:hypothetical protein